MRFDDTLKTVLAADDATPFGAQAAWRQIVDLVGRGLARGSDDAFDRLRSLRPRIPVPVRAASARALSHAKPPAELIALFAEDDDRLIVAPLLRTAHLESADWIALLPRLGPVHRSILRERRDLDDAVTRALEAFGPIDFVITDGRPLSDELGAAVAVPVDPQPVPTAPVADPLPTASVEGEPVGPFRIADVVARIDAHRDIQDGRIERRSRRRGSGDIAAFRFETDAAGLLRWIKGADRGPLVGLSIARPSALAQTDGVVSGAFRQRAAFRDARLEIGGVSAVAGSWRISGVPVFDPKSGRFTGYRGNARRPRAEEGVPRAPIEADSLRQLVHELRTPANAIGGFAEMIDTQLLGPVPETYRGYASAIRQNVGELLGVIDDLDLAARIEGSALALSASRLSVRGMIERIVGDLGPLAALRGAHVLIEPGEAVVEADARALERLLSRSIATVLGAAGEEDEIGIAIAEPSPDRQHVALTIDLPEPLRHRPIEALSAIDDEADGTIAPLGTGFAFRLIANLVRELGGGLALDGERLTLMLRAADIAAMDQAAPSPQ